MIVFASAITDPPLYERCAAPGIEPVAEPDSVVSPTRRPARSSARYNLILDMAAEREDLEALVLVHQDAEIDDPDFCAEAARRRSRIPTSGVVGCVGAIGVRNIAWWEGSVTWASFVHRYGELGGGELAGVLLERRHDAARLRPHGRGGHRRRLRARASRPGSCATCASTSRSAQLHGYDLDFCLQVREAGKKVVTADFKVIHHHSLDLLNNPDTWIQAHMQRGGEVGGPHARHRPGSAATGSSARGEPRPRRPRARAGRWPSSSSPTPAPSSSSEALDEVTRRAISWRLTAPLRWLNAQARRQSLRRPRPEPSPLSARRTSSCGRSARLGRDPGPNAQARQALGHGERARLEQPLRSTASWRRDAARWLGRGRPSGSATRPDAARGWPPGARASGCGPTVSSISATVGGPGRLARPDHAQARRTRGPRPAAGRRARDEVLHRGQHAVARRHPRCAAGTAVGQARRAQPGHAGEDAAALDDRLAVLRRDLLGVVVVVAAGVRPADVVEEQQRQRASPARSATIAQLLADRPVVVVAVDDHRVRESAIAAQRLEAGLADQLQLGAGARPSSTSSAWGERVDGHDAWRRPRRPTAASSPVRSPA